MNLLDLVFPKKCLRCRQKGEYLCLTCLKGVKLAELKCPLCERKSIDGLTHFKCQRKLGLDGIISVWTHQGVVNQAIRFLKYRFVSDIANELTEKYLLQLRRYPIINQKQAILVPIPLHRSREKWRGFNQAELLGKLITKKVGWEFQPDLLVRIKNTPPQTKLDRDDRKKNVKDAFVLGSDVRYPTSAIRHPIIIFDDVTTTGSTLREAGKILKRKKWEKVVGMTICQS